MKEDVFTIGGILAVLGVIGAAIKWAWDAWFGRLDRREKLIEEAEARLRVSNDAQMEAMRADLEQMKAELARLQDVANRQWAVIHMLVAKIDPTDPVLRAAEAFLGTRIFSVNSLPDDMAAMARKLDEGTKP